MQRQNHASALGALLRPHMVLIAALVMFAVGAGAIFAGAGRAGPMALLLAELLSIYAAILWSTPAIPPLSSRLPEREAAAGVRRRARVYDAPDR